MNSECDTIQINWNMVGNTISDFLWTEVQLKLTWINYYIYKWVVVYSFTTRDDSFGWKFGSKIFGGDKSGEQILLEANFLERKFWGASFEGENSFGRKFGEPEFMEEFLLSILKFSKKKKLLPWICSQKILAAKTALGSSSGTLINISAVVGYNAVPAVLLFEIVDGRWQQTTMDDNG